MDSFADELRT
jgi:regulator of telomere elongation helicase 1